MKPAFRSIIFVSALSLILLIASCEKGPDPVACCVVDKGTVAKENEEVQFDASCSTHGQTYSWDFGDGTMGQGIITKHKYAKEGNYLFHLSVKVDTKTSLLSQNITISK